MKTLILRLFGDVFTNIFKLRIFSEDQFLSLFSPYSDLTSWRESEKSLELCLRKISWLTNYKCFYRTSRLKLEVQKLGRNEDFSLVWYHHLIVISHARMIWVKRILFAEFFLVLLHGLTTTRSEVSEELHLVPEDVAEKCIVNE